VRQVGYLQRLYRDARSTEHKISTANYDFKSSEWVRLVRQLLPAHNGRGLE